MSLINDALKKAARQRAGEQGDLLPPMPGGGSHGPSSSGGPMKTQTLVLIAVGAVALMVVSAVVTGLFLSGKSEAKVASSARAAGAPAAVPAAAQAVSVTPVAAAPVVKPAPVVIAAPTAAPIVLTRAPAASAPTPTPVPVVARVEPTPAPTRVAASAAAPSLPAASHTDEVQAVVDRYHVSGVRAAGTGSKALIDGHIFKVNDVIDKTTGLRLVGVEEDHLTFTDANGQTYVKNL